MYTPSPGRPAGAYFLVLLVMVLAIGATGGGIALLADTSGSVIHMPLLVLSGTPFGSFLVPGLTLLLLLGIFPGLLVYPLLRTPDWRWAGLLNIHRGQYWAWTYSLYAGIMLVLWIDFQIMFVGYIHPLQSICALAGVAIIVCALLPPVMRHFETSPDRWPPRSNAENTDRSHA
jgi:hypothetical protein